MPRASAAYLSRPGHVVFSAHRCLQKCPKVCTTVLGHWHYWPSNAHYLNFRGPLYAKTVKRMYGDAIMRALNAFFSTTVHLLFLFLEVFHSHSTCRAHPAFREVFKCSSWRNTALRISFCRIVYVSAENAYISVHNNIVFGYQAESISGPHRFLLKTLAPNRLTINDLCFMPACFGEQAWSVSG